MRIESFLFFLLWYNVFGDIMKKVLIVSDNHGNKEVLEQLLLKHPDCSLYLHAGDSEDFQSNLYPYLSVKGNNDYYIENLYRIVKIENHSIYMVHGHRNFLSDDVMSACAKNNGCDIYVHGHIHRPYYKYYNGVHIMCPGSLRYPRSTKGETYIIMNIDENKVDVEIKSL